MDGTLVREGDRYAVRFERHLYRSIGDGMMFVGRVAS